MIDRLAGAFMAGRIDEILHCYFDNLTVYAEDEIMTFRGRASVRAAIVKHRDEAMAQGVIDLRGRIVVQPLVHSQRMRFTVAWLYDLGPLAPPRHAEATYFCRGTDLLGAIEMIEFRKLAFPESVNWYPEQSMANRLKEALAGGA